MKTYKVTVRTDTKINSFRGTCLNMNEFIEVLKKIESENKDYIALHFFITKEKEV